VRVRRVSPSENLWQAPTTMDLRCLDTTRDHALPTERIQGGHEDLGRLRCRHPSMRLTIVSDPDHLVVRHSEVDPSNWSRIGSSQLPKPLVRNEEIARNRHGEDSPSEVAHWLPETTDARTADLGQPRLRREMDQHHHGETASAQLVLGKTASPIGSRSRGRRTVARSAASSTHTSLGGASLAKRPRTPRGPPALGAQMGRPAQSRPRRSAEAQPSSKRSAGLRTPAGPRFSTWV
jgi:hypothetical protein